MATRLDKTTAIPLGIAVSTTIFFLFISSSIVTKYVKLESKVENLENNFRSQASQLANLNSQISELNVNMVRLSEIIKKLEEKIR